MSDTETKITEQPQENTESEKVAEQIPEGNEEVAETKADAEQEPTSAPAEEKINEEVCILLIKIINFIKKRKKN